MRNNMRTAMRNSTVGDSPESGLGTVATGAACAARRAHVALGLEAVAVASHLLVDHLLAEVLLLVGLLARGLALELLVVVEAHRGGGSGVARVSWKRWGSKGVAL
jgi:hypothetical protein